MKKTLNEVKVARSDMSEGEAKATARPWKFDHANNGLAAYRIAGDGLILADVLYGKTNEYAPHRDEAEANAALIVTAVDQHDALVVAANVLEKFLAGGFNGKPKSFQTEAGNALAAVRAKEGK